MEQDKNDRPALQISDEMRAAGVAILDERLFSGDPFDPPALAQAVYTAMESRRLRS